MDPPPPESLGTAHISGWSNTDIFLDFLNHFIKHVKPNKVDNKVLLILDNHEFHISIDAINLARAKSIMMLTIQPHTGHKLQPLDRGVFGRLKSYYNEACKSWFLINSGKPLTIYDIAGVCSKAYALAFTQTNITAGFKSSGLWPCNRNIFVDHEYFASLVTDRPNPECSSTSQKTSDGFSNAFTASMLNLLTSQMFVLALLEQLFLPQAILVRQSPFLALQV